MHNVFDDKNKPVSLTYLKRNGVPSTTVNLMIIALEFAITIVVYHIGPYPDREKLFFYFPDRFDSDSIIYLVCDDSNDHYESLEGTGMPPGFDVNGMPDFSAESPPVSPPSTSRSSSSNSSTDLPPPPLPDASQIFQHHLLLKVPQVVRSRWRLHPSCRLHPRRLYPGPRWRAPHFLVYPRRLHPSCRLHPCRLYPGLYPRRLKLQLKLNNYGTKLKLLRQQQK